MKNKKSSNLSAEKKKLGILIACMVLTIAIGYLILSVEVDNTSFSSTQYEPFAKPVYGSVFSPLAGYQLYRQVGPRHFEEVTDEPFGGHVFKAALQNDLFFGKAI